MKAVHSTTVVLFYVQLVACLTSQPQACPRGYFGTGCKYKCRCARDMCDVTGSCLGGDACRAGWFGPACQYADIAYGQPAGHYLTDGSDFTCRDYTGGTGSVTLNLPESYPFTWLRVHVSRTEAVSNLRVTFNNTVSCNNSRSAPVDGQTWDIYCSMDEFVQSVTLAGPAASSLCSIYISGGRDIAINEHARQTSTWQSYSASLSVDGNVNPVFSSGHCSATYGGQSTPDSWNVTLSRARVVNRYAIYNRIDSNRDRLKGFSLQSFDGSTRVFNYTNSQVELPVYTIKHGHLQISFLRITSGSSDKVLQMCEMEIYGDSICVDRQYGWECDHKCNCDGGQPCFVSTGGCPCGCASGYHGENCKIPCSPEKFGPGCLKDCHELCVKDTNGVRSCSRFNGACDLGCESGYRGSHCNMVCEPGKYGPQCNNTCSEHCANQTVEETSCDHVHGACRYGCQAGYKEPLCLSTCDVGKYGPGCGYNCSSICVASNTTDQSPCHHVTGFCMFGCLGGYDVMICKQDYGSPAGPDNRQLIGITVGCLLGVIIVAVIIAAGIIVLRRRKTTKSETHGSSPAKSNDYISVSRKDPSKVHQNLSDGGRAIPGVSTAGTQRAALMGSQGKIKSEDMFGYHCVDQSCDDDVDQLYEAIDDNLARPYAGVDDSNKDPTPKQNCPERRKTTKSETHGNSPAKSNDCMSLSRNDPSKVEHTLSDGGHDIPGVSTAGTQRAALMGSQGKIESEDMFGYDCVAQSCDDDVAQSCDDDVAQSCDDDVAQSCDDDVAQSCDDDVDQLYEETGNTLASPYKAVVDNSSEGTTPTDDSPEYANTP